MIHKYNFALVHFMLVGHSTHVYIMHYACYVFVVEGGNSLIIIKFILNTISYTLFINDLFILHPFPFVEVATERSNKLINYANIEMG